MTNQQFFAKREKRGVGNNVVFQNYSAIFVVKEPRDRCADTESAAKVRSLKVRCDVALPVNVTRHFLALGDLVFFAFVAFAWTVNREVDPSWLNFSQPVNQDL